MLCSRPAAPRLRYTDCLLRFATQKYDLDDLENAYSHLTNSSINKNSTSYGVDKEGIRAGCKWSLWRFTREHPDHPLGSPTLWARIKAIVTLTLLSIAADVPDNGGCFELLGYDVIVDAALKPWLLEVNTSPALGVECEADRESRSPPWRARLLALQREAAGRAERLLPANNGAAAAGLGVGPPPPPPPPPPPAPPPWAAASRRARRRAAAAAAVRAVRRVGRRRRRRRGKCSARAPPPPMPSTGCRRVWAVTSASSPSTVRRRVSRARWAATSHRLSPK